MVYPDYNTAMASDPLKQAMALGIMAAIESPTEGLLWNTLDILKKTALPVALEQWCIKTGVAYSPYRVADETVIRLLPVILRSQPDP